MSFLSVVLATYNRAETLRTTLDCLAAQTLDRDRYEVVVVDDESPDHTTGMIAQYQAHAPFPLQYLRHANRGPGYTQNRGIEVARGPWILLIADDIHLQPDALRVHFDTHTENPQPHVAVAGKVIQSPQLPETVFLKHWDPFGYEAFEGMQELSYLNFWACHVSFKKAFMEQHGMFTERHCCAHEDTELGWRLYRDGGMRLLYRPEALGHHYHLETIDAACKRSYERGLNFDILSDSVDDPALYVRSHIVTRSSWRYFFNHNDKNLVGDVLEKDRRIGQFLLRETIRPLVFNRLTVPTVMCPLIRAAEKNPLLASLISARLIRASVMYHFLRGLKDLRRKKREAQQTTLNPAM